TGNRLTLPVSGTGSAGMEASIVNVVEPGDRVVVGVNGVFGMRLSDTVRRCGAEAVEVKADWGSPLALEVLAEAVEQAGRIKALVVVHAETSTGARQPIEGLSDLAHDHGGLLVVDAVTSLGGMPVEVDA